MLKQLPFKPLLWLLAIPVLNIFYGILNHPRENVYLLSTALDDRTPFIPAFVVPYVIWYPFIFAVLIGLLRKDRNAYYRSLLALCLGLVSCYIVYLLFQTTVPRPDMSLYTGLFADMLNVVYATDMPYNCFPSIHVMTSYLTILAGRSFGPRGRWTIGIVGTAIILSTLFIKQHVIADVIAGIAVAHVVHAAAAQLLRLGAKREVPVQEV